MNGRFEISASSLHSIVNITKDVPSLFSDTIITSCNGIIQGDSFYIILTVQNSLNNVERKFKNKALIINAISKYTGFSERPAYY